MADRLESALSDAGVSYRANTYPAVHGWMIPNFPVYDPASAARGWTELTRLFNPRNAG